MPKSSPLQKSNVAPLADRVLVENIPPFVPPDKTIDRDIGGIFVKADSLVARTAAAKDSDIRVDAFALTRVIAAGPDCKFVKAGDRVVIARHHAFSLMPPGVEESTFVKETDVIAIVGG